MSIHDENVICCVAIVPKHCTYVVRVRVRVRVRG